jgi:hypothetical protein
MKHTSTSLRELLAANGILMLKRASKLDLMMAAIEAGLITHEPSDKQIKKEEDRDCTQK